MLRDYLYSFVEFPNKTATQESKKENETNSFRDANEQKNSSQGTQGNQQVSGKGDGKGSDGLPLGARGNDTSRAEKNQSERVFADMIANNFKFPKGYSPNMDVIPDLDDGPTFEEVSDGDLD